MTCDFSFGHYFVSDTASKKISNRYIGFHQFMSLSKFKHPENGYLLGDTCIIEAQFEVVGLIKRD